MVQSAGHVRKIATKTQIVRFFVCGYHAKDHDLRIMLKRSVSHESESKRVAIPLAGLHHVLRVQGDVINLTRRNAPSAESLRPVCVRGLYFFRLLESLNAP